MKGALFLCVADSARTQVAEDIGRARLPADARLWSGEQGGPR